MNSLRVKIKSTIMLNNFKGNFIHSPNQQILLVGMMMNCQEK